MAGSGEIRAGRAYVELLLRDQAFNQRLNTAGRRLKDFGSGITSLGLGMAKVGAAIITPLVGAAVHFVRTGDALGDMAERTGIAAGVLAELSYAADQSETDMETLEKAIVKMTIAIENLKKGSKDAASVFNELGLSARDFVGKKPDEQLQLIAERLRDVGDVGKRTRLALEIFGKSGSRLLPLMTNLKRLREEARAEGLVPSDEAIQSAGEIDTAMKKVRAAISAAAFEVGHAFGPAILETLNTIRLMAKNTKAWVSENQELVRVVAKAGAVLFVAGAAAVVLGKGLGITGDALMGISKLSTITAALASMPTKILRGFGAFSAARSLLAPAQAGVQRVRGLLASTGQAALAAGRSVARGAGTMAAAMARVGRPAGKIGGGLGAIAQGLGQIGVTGGRLLMRGIAREASNVGPLLARGLGRGFTFMAPYAQRAFNQVASRLDGPLSRIRSQVEARMARVWATVGPHARRAFFEAAMVVAPAVNAVSATVTAMWRRVAPVATSVANRVLGVWRRVAPAIGQALVNSVGGAFRRIRAIGAGTAAAMRSGAGNIGRGIGGVAAGLADLAGLVSSGAGGALGKFLGNFASAVPVVLSLGGAFAGLLNPITLVAAAVGGAIFLWTRYSDTGKAALAKVLGVLQPFVATFKATFAGIRDAIEAGDLALAAKVALAGLQVAFLEGVTALATSVGGEFGDFVGTLGSQIASGDLLGAWHTMVGGLVDVFVSGMNSILEKWKEVSKTISDWILKNAAEGGWIGSALMLGTGIDNKAELDKGQKADEERARFNAKFATEFGPQAAGAANAGGGLAEMQRNARGQLDAQFKAAQEALNRAVATTRTPNGANAGGNQRAADALAAAQRELDALRSKSAAAAEEARKKREQDAGGANTDPTEIKHEVFGSFSAAALNAAGGAASPAEKQHQTLKEIREQAKKQYEEQKLMRRALAGFGKVS